MNQFPYLRQWKRIVNLYCSHSDDDVIPYINSSKIILPIAVELFQCQLCAAAPSSSNEALLPHCKIKHGQRSSIGSNLPNISICLLCCADFILGIGLLLICLMEGLDWRFVFSNANTNFLNVNFVPLRQMLPLTLLLSLMQPLELQSREAILMLWMFYR